MKTIKEFSSKQVLKGFSMPAPFPEEVIEWFSENTLVKSVMGDIISPYIPVTQVTMYNNLNSISKAEETKQIKYNILIKNIAIRNLIDPTLWDIWDKVIISVVKTVSAERVVPGTTVNPLVVKESFDISIEVPLFSEKPKKSVNLEELFDELN